MFDRRSILKLIGGGVVGTLLSPAPWKSLYDTAYWTQNWSWIPRLKYGENVYIPTLSKTCPSSAGLLVRTVDGRPVRALGNPNNLLSQGGITALAAAETQLACAPSRVRRPLMRSSDGAYIAISWDKAMQKLTEKAKQAKASVASLSGDHTGSINDFYSSFLSKLGSADCYLMPSEEQNAQTAWHNMGGQGRIGYNIEEADYIFAIGATYLENWGAVVYNRKDYSKKRPTEGAKALTFTYAGTSQTNTAACADYYLPCNVASETVIALGIAHLLIRNGARSYFTGYEDFAKLTADYTPAKVESITGIPAAKFEEAVVAMTKAEKPLIIVGSETGSGIGVLPLMAGIACNLLLKSSYASGAGQLVSLPFPPSAFSDSISYSDLLENDFIAFSQEVAADKKPAPKLLIIHEANPVYALPKNVNVEQLIKKSGYVVSFSSFLDETALQADLVLPLSMGFERFDDIYTPYGCGMVNYSVGQPAVVPAYESRAAADILLLLAGNMGISFPIANAAELVAMKAEALDADMDSLIEGETYISDAQGPMSTFYFNVDMLAKAIENAPKAGALAIAPCAICGLGTASTGIPPFATKLMTNDQLVGTSMVAQMNKKTADSLNLKNSHTIKLSNEHGSVFAKVSIYEGVANNTLVLPYGLGHTGFDAFSQNKGENVINLTSVTKEVATQAYTWSPMYVTAQKV